MRKRSIWVPMVLLAIAAFSPVFAQASVDPRIPAYKRVSGIYGNLNSAGSDTMVNLMTLWAEGFRKHYGGVRVQVEGKGSSTAPPALIEGTAQFGPMSREMKSSEVDKFEAKYGFKPTKLRVAIDALAVYVNKDNPIKSLSFEELDGMFSKTHKSGHPDVRTWGDLGLTGDWANKPISLYGRNSASGTYAYFKEHALFKGDYKDTVKEQPGSASVVQGVAEDKYAIGYSGIGYKTSGVKIVPLSEKKGGVAYEGTFENAVSGKYPLSRFLYIYIVKEPGKPLAPLVREFLKFVLSREGQEVVVKDGFIPLSAELVEEELRKLE
ncbi:MAG: PstS family phosphate ABC transporter substrate-binding protein [bacterium]